MKPNGLRSSWRSDASGTTMRSKVQTESNASSSARRARSTISLTVTLSRKFGRYSASFIVNRPPSCYLHQPGPAKLRMGLISEVGKADANRHQTDDVRYGLLSDVVAPLGSKPTLTKPSRA